MHHLKTLGLPVGTAPYGWRAPITSNRMVPLADKSPLIEDPLEQHIMSVARDIRAEGHSLRGIAETLNAAGHKTRRGTAWRFQYVARMLLKEEAA
jgi:hypothetical protein